METQSKFKVIARQVLAKIIKQRQENSQILVSIPINFQNFVLQPLFHKLLEGLYLYLVQVLEMKKKYSALQEIVKKRQKGGVSVLNNQLNRANDRLGVVNRIYSQILLKYSDISNPKRDQSFFQALIYTTAKVMRESFTRQDFPFINQEINRIFRGHKFNLIQRRQETDKLLQLYPALKQRDPDKPQNINTLIARIEERNKIRLKAQVSNKKKPRQRGLSLKDPTNRSPLMKSLLPSMKQSGREVKGLKGGQVGYGISNFKKLLAQQSF